MSKVFELPIGCKLVWIRRCMDSLCPSFIGGNCATWVECVRAIKDDKKLRMWGPYAPWPIVVFPDGTEKALEDVFVHMRTTEGLVSQ